jgi:predicted DNA-binding ribbon-helix-helix protein
MRTTLDLEKPVLDELKKIKEATQLPWGQIASMLLAEALAQKGTPSASLYPTHLNWTGQEMGARIDIADKETLYRELDRS